MSWGVAVNSVWPELTHCLAKITYWPRPKSSSHEQTCSVFHWAKGALESLKDSEHMTVRAELVERGAWKRFLLKLFLHNKKISKALTDVRDKKKVPWQLLNIVRKGWSSALQNLGVVRDFGGHPVPPSWITEEDPTIMQPAWGYLASLLVYLPGGGNWGSPATFGLFSLLGSFSWHQAKIMPLCLYELIWPGKTYMNGCKVKRVEPGEQRTQ